MTSVPPASPEGGDLPPRHRPSLGNLAKDTTESDLWAFDDLDPDDGPAMKSTSGPSQLIPRPRDLDKVKPRSAPPVGGTGGQDPVSVHVNKPRPKVQTGLQSGQSKPGREFDDLDHWDETDAVPLRVIEPQVSTPAPIAVSAPAPEPAMPPAEPEETPRANAPKAPALPRLPGWSLSAVEKGGLVVLALLLLVGGAAIYLNTVSRLPTGSTRLSATDFPIQGKYATVDSAVSYWRAPANSEAVRRGTQLIPEVMLTTSGGPGAIRVFFRNSDGELVGDPVTRRTQAGAKIHIAATAGFEDVGMHAAYRTDKNHPWTMEVHEAPTENSPSHDFVKFFEMNISPDRR